MFEGKMLRELAGIPMRRIDLANNVLALAEPDPLTLANLTTKSLTLSRRGAPSAPTPVVNCNMRAPRVRYREETAACPRRRSGNARRTGRSEGTHPRPSPSPGRSSDRPRHTDPE